MDKNFTPLKKYLMKNRLYYYLTELHEENIKVVENNGFYLYNYNQKVLVPRDDEIIKLCRGLVLNKEGLQYNFPFKRFFNAHEKECSAIDWESAEILEKLDGSMISYWYTGSEWEVTTRGSFYPNGDSLNFKEVFKRLFNNSDLLLKGYSYVFELISKDNRIVTKYDKERVVLIGARDLFQQEELNQQELDIIAEELDVDRPRRYKATNVEECRSLFENMKDDEEGFVVVDKYFNRMKLKQESYLKMSRIINLKGQDILDYIMGKTKIDADFSEMDDLTNRINEVKKMYEEFKTIAKNTYNRLKNIDSQREFAERALRYNISGALFKMRKGVNIEDIEIRYDKLLELSDNKNGYVKGNKVLVILRGAPGSGKSTWVRDNDLENCTISMDSLRIMMKTPEPVITQEYNDKVYKMFIDIVETRLSNGSFTVVDNCHVNDRDLKTYYKLCDKHGFEIIEKTFDISLEECLRRNKEREEFRVVPEEVIIKMHKKIERLINHNNVKVI